MSLWRFSRGVIMTIFLLYYVCRGLSARACSLAHRFRSLSLMVAVFPLSISLPLSLSLSPCFFLFFYSISTLFYLHSLSLSCTSSVHSSLGRSLFSTPVYKRLFSLSLLLTHVLPTPLRDQFVPTHHSFSLFLPLAHVPLTLPDDRTAFTYLAAMRSATAPHLAVATAGAGTGQLNDELQSELMRLLVSDSESRTSSLNANASDSPDHNSSSMVLDRGVVLPINTTLDGWPVV